jgi:hypothetical protein
MHRFGGGAHISSRNDLGQCAQMAQVKVEG